MHEYDDESTLTERVNEQSLAIVLRAARQVLDLAEGLKTAIEDLNVGAAADDALQYAEDRVGVARQALAKLEDAAAMMKRDHEGRDFGPELHYVIEASSRMKAGLVSTYRRLGLKPPTPSAPS